MDDVKRMRDSERGFVRALAFITAGIALLGMPELVMAQAANIEEVAQGLEDDVSAIGSLILTATYPVGGGLLVYGVYCLYNHTKNQGNQGDLMKGITGCAVGVMLLGTTTVIDILGGTLGIDDTPGITQGGSYTIDGN